jgi:hypothetical protein
MCKVLRLVEPKPSKETIEALEDALIKARKGEYVGVALVLMHTKDIFTTDVAGEMRRHPTTGRGMVKRLDDHLAELAD